MTDEIKSAKSTERVLIQLYVEQLQRLDDELIPLLRERGPKIKRSEVVRELLDIAFEAIPCIDVAALRKGQALDKVIIEAIVKTARKPRQ